jgi:O-antigen ligase
MEWNKIPLLTKEGLGEVAWRLAILVLPWQTRLMFSDASIYISWFFLALAIIVAWKNHKPSIKPASSRNLIWMTLFGLIFVSAFTSSPTATWQWWVQVLLLGMFGWSLVISRVDAREFLVWNVVALIPHAMLAVHQAITQQVIGTKWLGIASQLPETRGVAVVDVDGVRHLRAYGGLPYPNILGGWLAFALPASLWLAITSDDRKKQITLSIVGALFTLALVLTHSRSAWVAVAIILALLGYHLHRSKRYALRITRPPLLFVLCSLLFVLIWQWPLLMTRVTGEGRLETRSVSERVSGVHAGLTVFTEHPWFGVGRDAFGIAYNLYPIPHNIPLLMLVETGLVGTSATVLLFTLFFKSIPIDKRRLILIGTPLLILAMLDHYLWSYWSGQVLATLSVIWYFLVSYNIDRSEKLG